MGWRTLSQQCEDVERCDMRPVWLSGKIVSTTMEMERGLQTTLLRWVRREPRHLEIRNWASPRPQVQR